MSTPTATPVDAFIQQLQASGLVPPDKLAAFIPPAAAPLDAESLTAQLVERGLLTKFQAQQVAAGKAKSLVIGSYVMLDRLSGGGGLLFKAQHRRMKRVVMIKPLPPSLMKTSAERVQAEVETAAQIAHPNLVAVQDLDEVGGAHFLVTEFVDGVDLATLVQQQGKLPIATACDYVSQAAAGLAQAHAQGLTHRDLKAECLFVDRAGVVKVFGLGIAAAAGGDASNDVAALGRVLYRLLVGTELPAGVAATPSLCAVRADVPAALDLYWSRIVSATPSERPTPAELAVALKSLDTLPQPATAAEPEGELFPELFAEAEDEAATVMTDGPITDLLPPPAAIAAPTLSVAPPAVADSPFAPAPVSAPLLDAPTIGFPTSPEFTLNVALPTPVVPAPAAPAPAVFTAPTPVPEFSFNVDPVAPVAPVVNVAASAAPAPGFAPAAVQEAPAAVQEIEEPAGFAVAFDAPVSVATPGFVADAGAMTATKSTAARKPLKKAKPIALPFNLQLDPKFLEPKYLAGAGGGVIVLLVLLVWAVAGGKQEKLPVLPVQQVVVKKPAPVAVPTGMFQLPSSDSLKTVQPSAAPRPAAAPTKPAGRPSDQLDTIFGVPNTTPAKKP
jgi:hypothetical protein